MTRFLLALMCSVYALSAVFSAVAQNTPAPAPSSAETAEAEAGLIKLSPPVYPPLARQARIMGDVKIYVHVRKDGSVESAELFSGHPMLAPSALASAKQSQFECRACSAEVNSFALTYSFHLDAACHLGPNCEHVESPPKVEQSRGLVVLTVEPMCECDPAETITRVRIRSMKCLYLWKCGSRREYPL
jgi:TonB family protein